MNPEERIFIAFQHATHLDVTGTPRMRLPEEPYRPKHEPNTSNEILRFSSTRSFSKQSVPLEVILPILRKSYGQEKNSRPIPSSGGFYGLEILVTSNQRSSLYRYHATDGSLIVHSASADALKLDQSVFNQFSGGNELLMIFGNWPIYVEKYGARALRYIYLEAGHLAQEILRQSFIAGIHSCPIGAFSDEEWQEQSGFLPLNSVPLYGIALGYK